MAKLQADQRAVCFATDISTQRSYDGRDHASPSLLEVIGTVTHGAL
jgi:hypothetical protein